jgi:hypothetical protein
MWDNIIRWWHYTWIRNAYRNCRDGITNLWKWAPVIWQDRDWDHYYIYAVLIHKLEKQATVLLKVNTVQDQNAKLKKCFYVPD